MKQHHYQTTTEWTGNTGSGTSTYRSYSRDHVINVEGKSAPILASSDPSFLGDPSRYNPEELFLASLSACHMLWFLHLCTTKGVVVVSYIDQAEGTMEESPDGSGRFTKVTLHPQVTVAEASMVEIADGLHHQANRMCFIANSCNFDIAHQAVTQIKGA